MDLRKLLIMQKELDEVIFKNSNITEYPRNKILLALLTELGELSNEVKSFKYWKKNVETDRERILDEFADCLHFALSLENNKQEFPEIALDNMDRSINTCVLEQHNIDKEFITTFNDVSKDEFILVSVLALGAAIGITAEAMEAAYIKKNKINYERQENGY